MRRTPTGVAPHSGNNGRPCCGRRTAIPSSNQTSGSRRTPSHSDSSLGNLDEARAYLDRALANQSSTAQHALLMRKRAALDETHALAVFGSDRPGGTTELRARLEGYWTRTLESLKAHLENAPEERDFD